MKLQFAKLLLVIFIYLGGSYLGLANVGETHLETNFQNLKTPIYHWIWRQPPYEIVWNNGFPYFKPYIDGAIWGGDKFNTIFSKANVMWIQYDLYPHGIYKSDDVGNTWQLSVLDTDTDIIHIVANPITPTIVLAATSNENPPGGIFYSGDGGVSWDSVLPGLIIKDIEFDAIEPNRVFASICCFPNGDGGIYKSENAGESWDLVLASEMWLEDIESHPVISSTLFGVRRYASQEELGLYRSDDSGESWTYVSYVPAYNIIIDSHDPNRFYAYGLDYAGIWRSENYGITWENVTNNLPYIISSPTILSAAVDPTNPNTLLVGLKYGGLYVSYNAGGSWQESNDGINIFGGGNYGPQCSQIAFKGNGQALVACSGLLYISSFDLYFPIVNR